MRGSWLAIAFALSLSACGDSEPDSADAVKQMQSYLTNDNYGMTAAVASMDSFSDLKFDYGRRIDGTHYLVSTTYSTDVRRNGSEIRTNFVCNFAKTNAGWRIEGSCEYH